MIPKQLLFFILFFTLTSTHTCKAKIEVYFSPDDNVEEKLVRYIDHASEKIHAAIFMITSNRITKALIRAKNRGVDIQIVTDASCATAKYSRVSDLDNGNIDIFCLNPPSNKKSYGTPLMHNKFAIIDHTLWTGSFNWTKSANAYNQENVIATDNQAVLTKYMRQFKKLKKRCLSISEKKASVPFDKNYLDEFTSKIHLFLRKIKEKVFG